MSSPQGSCGSWHFAEQIVAVEEEDPEPLAAPVAAVAAAAPGAAVAEDPAAAVAVEDAAPVPAVAVAPFRMQLPLSQSRRQHLQYVAPVAALALEDAAPVAAVAAAPAAEVAAAAQRQVFDLDYFRSFRPFTGGWKQHNAALSFFVHSRSCTTIRSNRPLWHSMPASQPQSRLSIMPKA